MAIPDSEEYEDIYPHKKIVLEKLRVGTKKILSEEYVLNNIDTDAFWDYINRYFVVDIRGFVWSEKLQDEMKLVSYPKTVWQYLKGRIFPKWLLNKYPVKMKEFNVRFERVAKFPEFRYPSDNGFVIHESIIKEEKWVE